MNLIICCTPLQVLIAREIVLSNGGKDNFYGVMLSPIKNKKYEHYFSLLKEITRDSIFIYRKQTIFSWAVSFFKLKLFLHPKQVDTIYLSNINDELLHLLIDSYKYVDLYTFDDGTANIIKSSAFYYRDTKVRTKILRRLLNIKTTMNGIKEKSLLHYTIYPNTSNIIERTKLIYIFNIDKSSKELSEGKLTKIFLGQPFYNSSEKNSNFIERLIKDLGIDVYIPHPREDYRIEQVPYIHSELVFEDLFLKEFADKKCIIYTFYSGALLNLLNCPNAKLISILPKELNDTVLPMNVMNEVYNVFKKFAIEVIEK